MECSTSDNDASFFNVILVSKSLLFESDINFEEAGLFLFINNITFGVIAGVFTVTVLIILSGLISASEVAFFSLTSTQLKEIKCKDQIRSHQIILNLLNNPKRLLATILIANNFVNISIVIICSYIVFNLFDFSNHTVLGFILQVIVISFIILLFGEIIPKVYANQNNVSFAKLIAFPLMLIDKLFFPLSNIMIKSTNLIEKKLKQKISKVSVVDLDHVLNITPGGISSESERKMLKGIVNLSSIPVKQIMKSRIDVIAQSLDSKFYEIIDKIKDKSYSRIPIYDGSIDKIKGILYGKDLLQHLSEGNDFEWQKFIREPYFVPENKKLDDLLKDFQEKKIHMAIVVDEYGGTSGILTLEDVLEEIVGEISDEFDTDEDGYTKINDNTYIFEGKSLLSDICKIMEIDKNTFIEMSGTTDSIGGLILEITGKFPKPGDDIKFKNFVFIIDSVDRRRIKRVKVVVKRESNT